MHYQEFSGTSAEILSEEETIVFRGLNSSHPQLQTFQETGIVEPWGGEATLYEHVNLGDTCSNFTSWTTDLEVAKLFAGEDGTILSVDLNEIGNNWYRSYEWSWYAESEITIEGSVLSAKVIPR